VLDHLGFPGHLGPFVAPLHQAQEQLVHSKFISYSLDPDRRAMLQIMSKTDSDAEMEELEGELDYPHNRYLF
jgi:hypothetical protein